MADEKQELRCGNCGFDISMSVDGGGHYFECKRCELVIYVPHIGKKIAVDIFRAFTRADIKQGINWISVKNLPEKISAGNYLLAKENKIHPFVALVRDEFSKTDKYNLSRVIEVHNITHFAYINLPEAEK